MNILHWPFTTTRINQKFTWIILRLVANTAFMLIIYIFLWHLLYYCFTMSLAPELLQHSELSPSYNEYIVFPQRNGLICHSIYRFIHLQKIKLDLIRITWYLHTSRLQGRLRVYLWKNWLLEWEKKVLLTFQLLLLEC